MVDGQIPTFINNAMIPNFGKCRKMAISISPMPFFHARPSPGGPLQRLFQRTPKIDKIQMEFCISGRSFFKTPTPLRLDLWKDFSRESKNYKKTISMAVMHFCQVRPSPGGSPKRLFQKNSQEIIKIAIFIPAKPSIQARPTPGGLWTDLSEKTHK